MSHQPFPTTGMHLDLGKASLAKLVKDNSDPVYAYIMTSVVPDGDLLQQTGTGPNFQRGYITLCTCMHRMRTFLPQKEWRDKWVAGFTSRKCGDRHWLFYLACVKKA